jgi:electron transfer flavoprotein alpha/beta subunit
MKRTQLYFALAAIHDDEIADVGIPLATILGLEEMGLAKKVRWDEDRNLVGELTAEGKSIMHLLERN